MLTGCSRLLKRRSDGFGYRLTGDVPMSLLLESDEIGGGECIDNLELVPTGSRPDMEADCVDVDIPASAVTTDDGIKLGLTRREVEKCLSATGTARVQWCSSEASRSPQFAHLR
jgi:hypothetical protein